MPHRYFVSLPIGAERAVIDGAEAHHLLHVLRARADDQVIVFDGSGYEFDAEVIACGRAQVEVAIRARREVDRELSQLFTLGVPLPKGDRQRWIVEKAVELGVTTLVPLHTERSVATSDKSGEKLDRYVIEASKQCGRNRLMAIATPQGWDEWLAAASADLRRIIADPTGRPLAANDQTATQPTFAAVGPEGGLTDDELAAARNAGWQIISLGPRILRIETAAVALVATLTLP